MEIAEIIGANVKRAREAAGLTQTELGASLTDWLGGKGWSRQAVWQAEEGKRQFAAVELVALALALGQNVGWFFHHPGADAVFPSGRTLPPENLPLLFTSHPGDRLDEIIGLASDARAALKDARDDIGQKMLAALEEAEQYLQGIEVRSGAEKRISERLRSALGEEQT